MRRLNDLKIGTKLNLVSVLVLPAMLALTWWIGGRLASAVLDAKLAQTKAIADVARDVVRTYVARVEHGTLDIKTAQAQAADAIRAMRYGSEDYVWINDMDARIIAHPDHSLEGKDESGLKDPTGKPVIVTAANVVKEHGEGSFSYLWPKTGHTDPQPKISYVVGVPEWKWVIGTGIYVDDAAKLAAGAKRTAWFVSLAIVALLLAVQFSVTGRVSRTLGELTEVASAVADGDVDHLVTHRSGDETGRLADAFRGMIDYLRAAAGAADALAGGDLSVDVQPRSEKDALSRSIAQAGASVRTLVGEVGTLTAAASGGELSTRADAGKLRGAYRDVVGGINATLDAVLAPMKEATSVLSRVAERDLSARMEGAYRGEHATLKHALNQAAENLEQALGEVGMASEQVAAASEQISEGSQALAQGASEQASAIEEVSSSLQEMSAMAKQSAANAREARELAVGARQGTQGGVESMTRLSDAMARIKTSSAATAKVVKTIDEIAFQTNLLALNAAVEAARAGDAGKGFAVVAEEVRSLAMRSAEAAKNTAGLIEESVRHAEHGVEVSTEVGRSLTEIERRVSKVDEVMGEVFAASEQQTQGIGQINLAVDQMNSVTQQVAANSEESASSSEELASQAGRMRAMVGRFVLSTTRPASGKRSVPSAPGQQGPRPGRLPADPTLVVGRRASARVAKPEAEALI